MRTKKSLLRGRRVATHSAILDFHGTNSPSYHFHS
jgi:hypothetical protein